MTVWAFKRGLPVYLVLKKQEKQLKAIYRLKTFSYDLKLFTCKYNKNHHG